MWQASRWWKTNYGQGNCLWSFGGKALSPELSSVSSFVTCWSLETEFFIFWPNQGLNASIYYCKSFFGFHAPTLTCGLGGYFGCRHGSFVIAKTHHSFWQHGLISTTRTRRVFVWCRQKLCSDIHNCSAGCRVSEKNFPINSQLRLQWIKFN